MIFDIVIYDEHQWAEYLKPGYIILKSSKGLHTNLLKPANL